MKRFLLSLVLCLALTFPAFAGTLNTVTVFEDEAIAAGANATNTTAINLQTGFNGVDGVYSLQLTLTGDGTAKAEAVISIDGSGWDSSVEIANSMTAGTYVKAISIPACRYLKIKVTETGTTDAITVSKGIVGVMGDN